MTRDWQDASLSLMGAAPVADAETDRVAAIVRRRALDDADAELLLDALGLNGYTRPAKLNTSSFAHGSQSGVDYHLRMGHASLCAACARFVEVRENRAERCAGGGCDSVQAYWSHKNAGEPTCAASRAAHAAYQQAQKAAKREAR